MALPVVLLLSANARAETLYQFERLWPRLEQPWYFNGPRFISSAGFARVFIADTVGDRILEYSSEGAFIRAFGRSGSGQGELQFPAGVGRDDAGAVYVGDSLNSRIQKFSPTGLLLRTWGGQGQARGQFGYDAGNIPLLDIAVTVEGSVYAVDPANHRVQQFDSNGSLVRVWGRHGQARGEFETPTHIELAPDQTIYVVDAGNNRIQRFSPEGVYLGEFGGEGSAAGRFSLPGGVAVDADGNRYVADRGNGRVQKIRPDGQAEPAFAAALAASMSAGEVPVDVALTESGRLLVLYASGSVGVTGLVRSYSQDGALLRVWGSSGGGDDRLAAPSGVAVGDDGRIYVADTDNNRILVTNAQGLLLRTWGRYGSGSGEFDRPLGIAASADGFVYVADSNNQRVQKFTGDGQFVLQWGDDGTGKGQFTTPMDVAVAPDRSVYVADSTGQRVQQFSSDGAWLRSWGHRDASGGWVSPLAITVAADGTVTLINLDSQNRLSSIDQFSGTGQYIRTWGTLGAAYGIEAAPDGSYFVASTWGHKIYRFSSQGRLIQTIDYGSGGDPGQLVNPADVAVLQDGRVVVTDSRNHRIQLYKPVARLDNGKAILVAGGGPYEGNALWNATLVNANFAYRALGHQGYRKEQRYYLSHESIDLDNNGELDDVAGPPTRANIRQAILDWAVDADNLVLYLVDHGGDGTMRLSETETLSVAELKGWLDELAIPGRVTVIYDACHSGSFVPALAAAKRTVIASSQAGSSAYFLGQGAQSFSSFFWLAVFNGSDMATALNLAHESMKQYQTLQVDADGDGLANRSGDLALLGDAYIGTGNDYIGSAPSIAAGFVDRDAGSSMGSIRVSGVHDPDGDTISKVWAVISPPNHALPDPDVPILELPSVNLRQSAAGDEWVGDWDQFQQPGSYRIAVYAQDRHYQTSSPLILELVVDAALRRKAVIVASGQDDPRWRTIAAAADQAYQALMQQSYAVEDVRYYSPEGTVGTYGIASMANLADAVLRWGTDEARDLLIFLVGPGDDQGFQVRPGEILSPDVVVGGIELLRSSIPGTLALIIDSDRAGRFVQALDDDLGDAPLLISSTRDSDAAPWSSEGSSFSTYFWQAVANGSDARSAYRYGQRAMQLAGWSDYPQLEANGNGTANERGDHVAAQQLHLGYGIVLAADAPHIGDGAADIGPESGGSARIWASGITTTDSTSALRVWATIDPSGDGAMLEQVQLRYHQSTGRWEADYAGFAGSGSYRVNLYARDGDGRVSLPYGFAVTP